MRSWIFNNGLNEKKSLNIWVGYQCAATRRGLLYLLPIHLGFSHSVSDHDPTGRYDASEPVVGVSLLQGFRGRSPGRRFELSKDRVQVPAPATDERIPETILRE